MMGSPDTETYTPDAARAPYAWGLSTCAGVSDTNCVGGNAWHYWQADDFHDSREFSEVPHHSFQLEHDALRVLDAAGVITMHQPASSLGRQKADSALARILPGVMANALQVGYDGRAAGVVMITARLVPPSPVPRTCPPRWSSAYVKAPVLTVTALDADK
jgi:hypothetical protein